MKTNDYYMDCWRSMSWEDKRLVDQAAAGLVPHGEPIIWNGTESLQRNHWRIKALKKQEWQEAVNKEKARIRGFQVLAWTDPKVARKQLKRKPKEQGNLKKFIDPGGKKKDLLRKLKEGKEILKK